MLKVLIAEDDFMIADMVDDVLVAGGYEVCGIARTVAEAVALGRLHKPDLAVIDMRLADGGRGPDIARQLGERQLGDRRLGVLYASGNSSQAVLTAQDGIASITKPYRAEDLLRALSLVTEALATGRAAPPFPRGFRLLDPALAELAPI